jgi:hypothetical protein
LIVLFVSTTTIASYARAETPHRDAAGALLREGNALYRDKDYAGALEKFRKAYALFPSPKIDFNLANALEALGRHAEAATHLERFLQGSVEGTPQGVLAKARARLEQLKRTQARLELSCAVEGAEVKVDGKKVGSTPIKHGLYLPPGEHRLELTKEGFVPFSRELELKAGEDRRIAVTLTPKKKPAVAATTSRPAPLSPTAASRPTSRSADAPELEHREPKPRSRLWAYLGLGTGLACAAAAGVLYGVGSSQGSEAHDKYQTAWQADEIAQHRGDVEAAEAKLVAGHVLAGVAAVAIGFSVYQFISTKVGSESSSPTPRETAISLSPLGGGAAMTLRGRF